MNVIIGEYLFVFAILAFIIIAAIQFALCLFKWRLLKHIPIITFVITWIVSVYDSRDKNGFDTSTFLMSVISPIIVIGIIVGWFLYHMVTGRMTPK